jgi:hypothetical protein
MLSAMLEPNPARSGTDLRSNFNASVRFCSLSCLAALWYVCCTSQQMLTIRQAMIPRPHKKIPHVKVKLPKRSSKGGACDDGASTRHAADRILT